MTINVSEYAKYNETSHTFNLFSSDKKYNDFSILGTIWNDSKKGRFETSYFFRVLPSSKVELTYNFRTKKHHKSNTITQYFDNMKSAYHWVLADMRRYLNNPNSYMGV